MAAETNDGFAAIVLHYRDPVSVKECVKTLEAQSVPPTRIVVVDNGSDPGELDDVAALQRVKVVSAGDNLGYGGGMRLGLHHTGSDTSAVLFVTQDCILAPDAAANLMRDLAADADVGAVAPVLHRRSRPDVVWSAGGTLSRWSMWTGHLTEPSMSTPYDVTWLDGAAMLVRRQALDDVQWDDGYFLYFEDVEFSCRCRAAGWRIKVSPSSSAAQEPGTMGVYLAARNHLRFVRRNGGRVNLLVAVLRHVGYLLADVCRSASSKRRSRIRPRARGIADALSDQLRP